MSKFIEEIKYRAKKDIKTIVLPEAEDVRILKAAQEAMDVLSEAFLRAFEEEEYQEVLHSFYVNPLGLTGEEAKEYLSNWQKSTADAFYKSGAIDKSPEELGIK